MLRFCSTERLCTQFCSRCGKKAVVKVVADESEDDATVVAEVPEATVVQAVTAEALVVQVAKVADSVCQVVMAEDSAVTAVAKVAAVGSVAVEVATEETAAREVAMEEMAVTAVVAKAGSKVADWMAVAEAPVGEVVAKHLIHSSHKRKLRDKSSRELARSSGDNRRALRDSKYQQPEWSDTRCESSDPSESEFASADFRQTRSFASDLRLRASQAQS
jgi:hypothetical protein